MCQIVYRRTYHRESEIGVFLVAFLTSFFETWTEPLASGISVLPRCFSLESVRDLAKDDLCFYPFTHQPLEHSPSLSYLRLVWSLAAVVSVISWWPNSKLANRLISSLPFANKSEAIATPCASNGSSPQTISSPANKAPEASCVTASTITRSR